MGKFKDLLEKQEIIILDGALGTELESLGYDVSGKLWSAQYLLDQPQRYHHYVQLSGQYFSIYRGRTDS